MRLKTGGIILFAFLAAGGVFNYASALAEENRPCLSPFVCRVRIIEMVTVGNSEPKLGGAYSLFGSTGQLGFSSLSGGRYKVTWGIVNSWRPPLLDLTTAHVYPNPCAFARGCNGITFTSLTLRATIDIFTISGEKVRSIEKNSNNDGVGWDLRNESGSRVVSGLYLYVIRGEGSTKNGKIVIVR
ncbi:MAG: T9SS type A sorting domain-containing protein [Elusimicrobiota bacterium]|nr:T9SS type A sorting domain-containing protein [Elusimicrobiota bacterium]